MKWTARIDAGTGRPSKHSIQCGEWTISRTCHSGKELYTLWRGNEVISSHDTAEQAKAAAQERKA